MDHETETPNVERFDPREGSGKLIDSEHRARYHWAAQAVNGKDVLDAACGVGYGIEILAEAGAASVTGVNVDASAIKEAKSRFGKRAASLLEADLRELPLEDESFDVVACFEAIEHIDNAPQALAELRRVLRSDGILILSSPNAESYPQGNEFHVHEFDPEELRAAVGEHFEKTASYRQDAWLGSTIEKVNAIRTAPDPPTTSAKLLVTSEQTDNPDYLVLVACDAELPDLPSLLARGDTFDVRWWSEQMQQMRTRLESSEGETAQAQEREEQVRGQLEDTATSLLNANQELAQIPVLRHRLATLEELHGEIADRYHEMLGSTSWRITAPLRRIRRRRAQ